MGRKIQVTKEQMLEAGLRIIIRDGYPAVSIKTVAAELGCSTTPIAWSFENIENYRHELRRYATQYMYQAMTGDGVNAVADYKKIGEAYVDMAINEPNLLHYLRSDLEDLEQCGGIGFIFDVGKKQVICDGLVEKYGITQEEALDFVEFTTTYTEGLVSMILSGVYQLSNEDAYRMVSEGGTAYLAYIMSPQYRSRDGKLRKAGLDDKKCRNA